MSYAPHTAARVRAPSIRLVFRSLFTTAFITLLTACGVDIKIDSHTPQNSIVHYLEEGESLDFSVSGPTYSPYVESLFQVGVRAQWAVYRYEPDDYLAGPVTNIVPWTRNAERIQTTPANLLNAFNYRFTAPVGEEPQYYLITYTLYRHNLGGYWKYAESSRSWLVYVGENLQTPPQWEGDFLISTTDDIARLAGYTDINGTLSVMPFSADYTGEAMSGDNLVIVENRVEEHDRVASLPLGSRDNTNLITELGDLVSLRRVRDNLYLYHNTNLTSLDGLQNLESVGGHLMIFANPLIRDLQGLATLNSVGQDLYLEYNASLESIEALNGIQPIIGDNLVISRNASLANLKGFEHITNVTGRLDISGIPALETLNDLSALETIGDDFTLVSNDGLTSLEGLGSLRSINGSLTVENSDQIRTLLGAPALNSIDGLRIKNNLALENLDGLEQVSDISGNVTLYSNPALASLSGLQSLETIGGELSIDHHSNLLSLTGLDRLTHIGQSITVRNNYNLTSIESLFQLERIERFFSFHNNYSLCDSSVYELLELIQSREGVGLTPTTIDNDEGC